jgi:2-keto-4-pentenoate hydratase
MTSVDSAARQLVAARLARRPGARLPESCRPRDNETALAIQHRVGELLGFDVGGWKCSLPTPDKVAFIAPIYAPTITSVSPCRVRAEGAKARVEPEIAFVLGHDLPRRTQAYSEADVRAAIRETRLVLELIGCRYADPASAAFLEMLADGLNGEGLFVGPEVSEGLTRPLENIEISVADQAHTILTHTGSHGDGHPLRPLVWLVNFLASRGEGLTAGQIVTTGSYAGVLELPLVTPLDVRFGDLGTLSVQFVGME